jgi:hypothetical protein
MNVGYARNLITPSCEKPVSLAGFCITLSVEKKLPQTILVEVLLMIKRRI